MAFDSLVSGGELLVCVDVVEAGPSGLISLFDGYNPSRLDWEADRGVEVVDQFLGPGKIIGA